MALMTMVYDARMQDASMIQMWSDAFILADYYLLELESQSWYLYDPIVRHSRSMFEAVVWVVWVSTQERTYPRWWVLLASHIIGHCINLCQLKIIGDNHYLLSPSFIQKKKIEEVQKIDIPNQAGSLMYKCLQKLTYFGMFWNSSLPLN